MKHSVQTFGKRVLELQTASELLELERAEGRDLLFQEVDACLGQLIHRSLASERVVSLTLQPLGHCQLALPSLDTDQRSIINNIYDMDRQRSRGALFIPNKVSLKVGIANLPFAFSRFGRFGYGMSQEEKGQVLLAESPDAILTWSILASLFKCLYMPIILRSETLGEKTGESHLNLLVSE